MPPSAGAPWLFGSFFLGGFECSTHRTTEGRRADPFAESQHDRQAKEDYARCRSTGIRAVREAARWPMVDRGARLDLAEVRHLARLGREAELTLIWDLMHYGYPDDLDPYSDEFVDRFARYAAAVARAVREETRGRTYYTPVNEISYFAWAGGEVGYMAPFGRGHGRELKRALARAAIRATDAIWEADPEATMLNVDPLVRVYPPPGRPDLQPEADLFNRTVVWQGFDMLSGRLAPELGGSRAHLGIVGFNYYSYNQWTMPTAEHPRRFLGPDDPDWARLSDLLVELQSRFGGPVLIAETGAGADQRPGWIRHLTGEAKRALDRGVHLQGICFYPIVTSPDWEDTTAFFDGGLFDVAPRPDGRLERILTPAVAAALREAQAELDPENLPPEPTDGRRPTADDRRRTTDHTPSTTDDGRQTIDDGPPTTDHRPPTTASSAVDGASSVVRLAEHARLKGDNFSHETLLAGESLTVELYTFGPGAWVGAHRHATTEHVLSVVAGTARVRLGECDLTLHPRETLLVPAGLYHSIRNDGTEPLLVQQVSAPKPWDARFGGPHPASLPGTPRQEPSSGRPRATHPTEPL